MAPRKTTKKSGWATIPPAGKTIIITMGAGLSVWGMWSFSKWLEEREMKERLKHREKHDCQGVNLSAKAYNIWDAMWNYMGGMAEDEETAVNELLMVPKECIPELAKIYLDDFGKNLYEDFTTYVEGEQYEQVRHLLEENLRAYQEYDPMRLTKCEAVQLLTNQYRRLLVADRLYN